MLAVSSHDLSAKLNPEQMLVYQQLSAKKHKSMVVAMLLALFLGAFGVHKFYQGKILVGSLYLLFCWTLVPAAFAMIDLFFIPGQIKWDNEQGALQALIQAAPTVSNEVQTLLNAQSSVSFIETVIKIMLGILMAWLLYVSLTLHQQNFHTDEAKIHHWLVKHHQHKG